MDSASLLESSQTGSTKNATEAPKYHNMTSLKPHRRRNFMTALFVIAVLVVLGLLQNLSDETYPTPLHEQFDSVVRAIRQLDSSSFRIHPLTVSHMETKLHDFIVSTLKNQSIYTAPTGEEIRLRTLYIELSNRFQISFTLSRRLSTDFRITVHFDHDNKAVVVEAFQVLNSAFNSSITITVPRDSIAYREQAISDFCRNRLIEFPSIIEETNIYVHFDKINLYLIRLISGTYTEVHTFKIDYILIDQSAVVAQLDMYYKKLIQFQSEKGFLCIEGTNVYNSSSHRELALTKFVQQYIDEDQLDVHLKPHGELWFLTMTMYDVERSYVLEDVSFRDEFLSDVTSRVKLGLGSVAILTKQRLFIFDASGQIRTADVVNHFYHKLVRDVALGDYHIIVLTEDHEVHCYGPNDSGQLGIEDRNTRYANPDFRNERVISVYAGGLSSGAITSTGAHWVWGSNDKQKLSDNHGEVIDHPTRFAFDSSNSYSISFGTDHTLILTSFTDGIGGRVYSMGCMFTDERHLRKRTSTDN
ncbi:hypothetical protein GEMRC1_000832 [Eukaryota sp. GEM-RC1]